MRRFTGDHLHGSKFEASLQMVFGRTAASIILYGLELLEVALISLAIILPIRYFLIQPFYVKGASMEPNFIDHEYLVIDELSYRFREPQRGEIVVFRYPDDPSQYFIKRVIGLPKETVKIENGVITIMSPENSNGFVLDEVYLQGVFTGNPGTRK